MKKDKFITVRIDKMLYKDSFDFAKKYGLSLSHLIRLLLLKEVRKENITFVKDDDDSSYVI